MAPTYAGILGPLALLVVLAQGTVHGNSLQSTLMVGWIALIAFSAIGYVAGRIAETTVDRGFQDRVNAEIENMSERKSDLPTGNA